MQIYKEKEMCNGCRACEQICPKRCIYMVEDRAGFLYPKIDERVCIDCELCKQICEEVTLHCRTDLEIAFAAKNKEDIVQMESSSGGIFYALAEKVIKKGGIVFGAAYDTLFNVSHKSIKELKDLKELMGSKYVQSDTKHTYRYVKKILKEGKLCLYSGTPCQIAGLRGYLRRDDENLICVSIICHGVPSPAIWRKYLAYQKGRYGDESISSINFREKYWGWRAFSFEIKFSDYIYHEIYTEDLYMKGFLQNLYLRPSCYSCRVKEEGQKSDIILGDFWGIEECHPEFDDRRGISAVVINSHKGLELFNEVKDNLIYIPSTYDQIKKYNNVIDNSVSRNEKTNSFFEELYLTGQIDISIQDNLRKGIDKQARYQYQYPIIMEYLKRKIEGKELYLFLNSIGFYRIAIYALTEFAELVYKDLLDHPFRIRVVCVGDKNYQKYKNGFYMNSVIGLEDLAKQYEQGEIDGILNCSVFHSNEVFQDLLSKGIRQEHIVSVVNSIYMLKNI